MVFQFKEITKLPGYIIPVSEQLKEEIHDPVVRDKK